MSVHCFQIHIALKSMLLRNPCCFAIHVAFESEFLLACEMPNHNNVVESSSDKQIKRYDIS